VPVTKIIWFILLMLLTEISVCFVTVMRNAWQNAVSDGTRGTYVRILLSAVELLNVDIYRRLLKATKNCLQGYNERK
jgi:hypothetical protein